MAGIAVVLVAAGAVGARLAIANGNPSSLSSDQLLQDVNGRVAADPNRANMIGTLVRSQAGIFAVRSGDAADVDLLAGKGSMRCLSVSGGGVSGAFSCFDQKNADQTGSWMTLPSLNGGPAIVVGVLPQGKTKGTVTAGAAHSQALVHGRFFLATVSAADSSSVTVSFSGN